MHKNRPYHLMATNNLTPADRRVIRNLAASLCVAAGINHQEHQFASLLGLGGEQNNGEAMESWVFDQLSHQELEASREALPHLLRQLMQLEANYYEERCYA